MGIVTLLKEMNNLTASDIHLVAGAPPTYRVAQDLVKSSDKSLDGPTIKKLVYEMLNEDQIIKLETEKELDFAYEVVNSRFRVNAHFEKGNLACAIRHIPKHVPGRDQLHLPEDIDRFCDERKGLILVTGPTGSGKSTTQAYMIDRINSTIPCHIVTIEDPIEYIHYHKKAIIEQREVGIDTFSFNAALKRILRQDPDVILVGEMRDLETIQIVLTAAETGHLVISTLHTIDAPQSIDRIIDVFPPHQQDQVKMQLSLVLKGVFSQQLLPRRMGKGVVPAVEIMVANSAVRNIIRSGHVQELYSMIEIGTEEGMKSMDNALRELYKAGEISREMALNRASNEKEMLRRI